MVIKYIVRIYDDRFSSHDLAWASVVCSKGRLRRAEGILKVTVPSQNARTLYDSMWCKKMYLLHLHNNAEADHFLCFQRNPKHSRHKFILFNQIKITPEEILPRTFHYNC